MSNSHCLTSLKMFALAGEVYIIPSFKFPIPNFQFLNNKSTVVNQKSETRANRQKKFSEN